MKYVALNQVAQKLWLVERTAFQVKYFVCFWCDRPQSALAFSFTRSLDRTQLRTTVCRTPLDERSARRRDL